MNLVCVYGFVSCKGRAFVLQHMEEQERCEWSDGTCSGVGGDSSVCVAVHHCVYCSKYNLYVI